MTASGIPFISFRSRSENSSVELTLRSNNDLETVKSKEPRGGKNGLVQSRPTGCWFPRSVRSKESRGRLLRDSRKPSTSFLPLASIHTLSHTLSQLSRHRMVFFWRNADRRASSILSSHWANGTWRTFAISPRTVFNEQQLAQET